MIETKESRAEFEKTRAAAQKKMRAVFKGELPLDLPQTGDPKPKRKKGGDAVCANTRPDATAPVVTPPQSNPAPTSKPKRAGTFDRAAYQREYMRKRRAEQRKAK